MKKVLTICDRCGDEFNKGGGTIDVTTGDKKEYKKEFCDECYRGFLEFMESKTRSFWGFGGRDDE